MKYCPTLVIVPAQSPHRNADKTTSLNCILQECTAACSIMQPPASTALEWHITGGFDSWGNQNVESDISEFLPIPQYNVFVPTNLDGPVAFDLCRLDLIPDGLGSDNEMSSQCHPIACYCFAEHTNSSGAGVVQMVVPSAGTCSL